MQIRRALPADAEAIAAIYNVEVTTSTVTFDLVPRTLADQLAWIEHHSGAHPAIVAVDEPGSGPGPTGANDEIVLGFGSLSPYKERAAYATTVEDSIYVDRAQRGRGIGKALLTELMRLAAQHGFHSVIARIVGNNEVSIAVHEALGFTLVGVETEVGRKHRQWLDVVELQRLV